MLGKTELCCYCEKRAATKSHDEIRRGKKRTEYFCLYCFERLFLYEDEDFFADPEAQIGRCPDCGRTAREFFKTGLVGCANCYKHMKRELFPSIVKMQGDRAHVGKSSELSKEREKLIERRNEAKDLVEKCLKEHRYAQAQENMRELKRLNGLLYGEED